jgi:DNA-binding transcriptional ArsR family regulator
VNRIQPIHEYKAQFFQALAHPLRIHILELLRDGPQSVSELQARIGSEAGNISQQLAVLRNQHIVHGRKHGTSVFYEVVDPLLFEVLDASRKMFLHQVQDMQTVITASEPGPAPPAPGRPVHDRGER